ncbi:Bifunctional solanapyrone synthase [Lachnellula suecica]|uniref:Bifunctional solanapyrone synthase n=1 Tax=Lachnellula suecica TaxID=602035 RepID=A0A8T9BUE3_9HELO|nr:Bifunctional solanapyrone synthase [Lachnellula suecica]
MSDAIKLFTKNQVQFAIRGGGYMALDGASNIGSEGILIANTNFTTLAFTEDKSALKVGAGIKWPALYNYLDGTGVTVNGIRIGDVGVIGYLLGGGIGFFSYELHDALPKNWSNNSQCVLGTGEFVTASPTENTDLFWALRGGGNNFCAVTEVELKTIVPRQLYMGNIGYGVGPDVQKPYIEGMVDFAINGGADPASAIEGQTRWAPSRNSNVTYFSFLFHNGNETSKDAAFPNLKALALPFVSGNFTEKSQKTWFDEFPSGSDLGNRKRFIWVNIPATAEAYSIAIDTYYKEIAELASVGSFFTALSTMPITSNIVEDSAANGGNPLGLNADSAPSLWLVLSPSWKAATDDATVDSVHARATAAITTNLNAAGIKELPFYYLSDAAKGQPVFAGYGQENWDKLKEISLKYDPEQVFQYLLPGGHKLWRGTAAKRV